jgi:C-terminal processing protease CtpA/Prc
VFSLDVGKIEEAPTTMHSFQIQKISNEDVGLKLAQGQNGGVYIAEMDRRCKLRGAGVKSGMRIAKINGVDCPNSIRVTTSFINGIEGKLNLVTTFGAKPKATKSPQIFFSSY